MLSLHPNPLGHSFDDESRLVFSLMLDIDILRDHVKDIVKLISQNELDRNTLKEVLDKHGIKGVNSIKDDLLDIIILYITHVLDDHVITETEKKHVEILKLYFKIREGDFYKYRFHQLQKILYRQLNMMKNVNEDKETYRVSLQDMFDLSYDQLEQFGYK